MPAEPHRGSKAVLGPAAGAFFAIVLLNASLIGAGALTLSTSYAFGDIFGTKSSLHRSFRDAKGFYAMFSVVVVGAATIVLIPGAPLGLITEAVQALAGVLLPSASMFLLLLCNDREVLGPWRNRPWLNALASVIVAMLVLLSLILMATTLFPSISVTKFAFVGGAVLAIGLLGLGAVVRRSAATARAGALARAAGPQGAVDDAADRAAGASRAVDDAPDRDADDGGISAARRRAAGRQGHPARRRLTT